MIGWRVANFEKFALTPLSFLFPIVALIYFLQAAWFVGAYFLFAWFVNALIGQSIHMDKNFDELVRGGLADEKNIRPDSDTFRDAHELARPLMFTAWLLGLTAAVLLFHYGYGWFVSIPIGFSVAIVMPMILVFVFARPMK